MYMNQNDCLPMVRFLPKPKGTPAPARGGKLWILLLTGGAPRGGGFGRGAPRGGDRGGFGRGRGGFGGGRGGFGGGRGGDRGIRGKYLILKYKK